jgi:hypothetical protein
MSDVDTLVAGLTAENLALRSLLSGLLIEIIRRGHIGIVSNAFAYSIAPLEGLTREIRPTQAVREKARDVIRELRDEVLGMSEEDQQAVSDSALQTANRTASV